MNVVEIATSYGNNLHDEVLEKQVCKDKFKHENLKALTKKEREEVVELTHEKYISLGFIAKANYGKYGHVSADLENDYKG